jgi:hypothetical protein
VVVENTAEQDYRRTVYLANGRHGLFLDTRDGPMGFKALNFFYRDKNRESDILLSELDFGRSRSAAPDH